LRLERFTLVLAGTKPKPMRKQYLEDRLIAFSTQVIQLTKCISKSEIGIHLSKQISRSGTSVFLNYGEAQSAESRRDFVHKMKVILKELRETHICLRLIENSGLYRNSDDKLSILISENNQLIALL
jgi:four helix bundle protein